MTAKTRDAGAGGGLRLVWRRYFFKVATDAIHADVRVLSLLILVSIFLICKIDVFENLFPAYLLACTSAFVLVALPLPVQFVTLFSLPSYIPFPLPPKKPIISLVLHNDTTAIS